MSSDFKIVMPPAEWVEPLLKLSEEYRLHEDEAPRAVLAQAMRNIVNPLVSKEPVRRERPGDVQYMTPDEAKSFLRR